MIISLFLSAKHEPQTEHLNLSKPTQIFSCAWNVWTYQMTYCTLNILMNLYIFYNASVVLVCLQTLSCILNNMSHFFHHVLLSLQHHMCYHHPIMIYMKMWNKQVIIYKEIHMNVLYMMTTKFTYINFYIVNMNYLWNDIYTY